MAQAETETQQLPNDRWDGAWVAEANEWKPRPRTRVVGGIEWLARMSDKARAGAKGSIGEYVYPCPADMKLLTALELEPEVFQQLAVSAADDEALISSVRETSPAIKGGTFSFTRGDSQAPKPPQ